jgi:hypothetical protein
LDEFCWSFTGGLGEQATIFFNFFKLGGVGK